MLHIAKYTKAQAGPILSHYENEEYRRHSSSVNPERTPLNVSYQIDGNNKRGHDRLKELLERDDVYCSPRKDVKVLFDTVITAPLNLPKDREMEFFNHAARFISDRFSQAAIISINLHYDENSYYDKEGINKGAVRPHAHIAMCPTVWDKKKERWKVSAKETITKETLLTLHQDFKRYIDSAMGLDLEILNGATTEANKSILELKTDTLNKEIQSQENEIQQNVSDIKKLNKTKNRLQGDLYELVR